MDVLQIYIACYFTLGSCCHRGDAGHGQDSSYLDPRWLASLHQLLSCSRRIWLRQALQVAAIFGGLASRKTQKARKAELLDPLDCDAVNGNAGPTVDRLCADCWFKARLGGLQELSICRSS